MRNYHFTEIRGILKKNSSGYFVVVSDETIVFLGSFEYLTTCLIHPKEGHFYISYENIVEYPIVWIGYYIFLHTYYRHTQKTLENENLLEELICSVDPEYLVQSDILII